MGIKTIARRLGLARNTVRRAVCSQSPPPYRRDRRGSLRAQGTLNPEPASVVAEPFRTHPEFFDAEDKLQVRYELLRAPAQGDMTVAEACRSFGVSRQTFYTLRRAFEARGLAGLTEAKRGRKGPLKAPSR